MRLLVDAYIASDQAAGVDTPVRNFVREFRGLSSTQKAAAVLKALPGVRRMADLDDRPDLVATLHADVRPHHPPRSPRDSSVPLVTPTLRRPGGRGARSLLVPQGGRDSLRRTALCHRSGCGRNGAARRCEVRLEFQSNAWPDRSVRTLRAGGGQGPRARRRRLPRQRPRARQAPEFDDDGVPALVAVHLTAPGLSFAERGKATLSALPRDDPRRSRRGTLADDEGAVR